MDASAVAAAFAASSAAKVQAAVAAKIMKMNADASQGLVAVLEQSAETLAQLVNDASAGVGGNVDISV